MRRLVALLALALSSPALAGEHSEVERVLDRIEVERSRGGGDLDAALAFLEPRSKTATSEQKSRIQLLSAYRNVLRGRYEEAIAEAKLVAQTSDNNDARYRAHLLIANASAITREFSQGLRELDAALAMQNTVRDVELRDTGLGVAAILYNQYGQYGLGRAYAERMLSGRPSDRNRCFAQQIRVEALFFLSLALDETRDFRPVIDHCETHSELSIVFVC